jgi:hypothetical protein
MALSLEQFVATLVPERTVLLFGAGASVPSGAPIAGDLVRNLATTFGLQQTYSLSEIAGLIEIQHSRTVLIQALRSSLARIVPTRGLLNLPLHQWKGLFTTNYDQLIEAAYKHHGKTLSVVASSFDFSKPNAAGSTVLFKLHGDIHTDVVDGHQSRLILTEADYGNAESYRETLFDRLKADVAGAHLVIIGHSLADPDIRSIVERAARIANQTLGGCKVTLLMYSTDDQRARLLESRGITVCFAGIDEFFAELARSAAAQFGPQPIAQGGILSPVLVPTTIDVSHAVQVPANLSSMFNGWPASYADIAAGTTFSRSVARRVSDFLTPPESLCALMIGPGGVGKTTAARQCLTAMRDRGRLCYEHIGTHRLDPDEWQKSATAAQAAGLRLVLFIDDAHSHLQQVNALVDKLASSGITALQLLLASSRHQWYPRIKSAYLNRKGSEFSLGRLESPEIDDLMRLVEGNAAIQKLVEPAFAGFSRESKRRRLVDRCSSELFVCLRNIFASEKFDDIILRDYASLGTEDQDIYRHVAALESARVIVHRQFVMRLLNIDADSVKSFLKRLTDIVHEYTVDEAQGIYAWHGRHVVIADIVSRYKFPRQDERVALFSNVIGATNPTYEIEVRTLRELCNYESGIASIADVSIQNRLLRQVISVVPGERVPRHRLIRNLIESGQYEHAETEIRIFEKDFYLDGPTARYKISLIRNRAMHSPGLQDKDRVVILEQATSMAVGLLTRFQDHKAILKEYVLIGLEIHRRTGDFRTFDDALGRLKRAEQVSMDPDMGRLIDRFQKMIDGSGYEENEATALDDS